MDLNNAFKSTVVGGLALVPEVGGILSLMASLLWPDSDSQETLDGMRDYVKQMMQQAVDDAHLQAIRDDLNGILANMKSYSLPDSDGKQQGYGQNVITEGERLEPTFFDDQNVQPWKTMPYLVTFCTIRLSSLRDEVAHYNKIWGDAPNNPADLMSKLSNKVTDFTTKVNTAKQEILDWRKGQIRVEHTMDHEPDINPSGESFAYTDIWTVTDISTSYSRDYVHRYSAFQSADSSNESDAKADWRTRQLDVDTVYKAHLESLTDITELWKYYDPLLYPVYTLAPGDRVWCETIGSGISFDGPTIYWDDHDSYIKNGPVSGAFSYSLRESITETNRLCGLVLRYGSESPGLRGSSSADTSVSEYIERFARGGRIGVRDNIYSLELASDMMMLKPPPPPFPHIQGPNYMEFDLNLRSNSSYLAWINGKYSGSYITQLTLFYVDTVQPWQPGTSVLYFRR